MHSRYHIKKVEFESGRAEYWIYERIKLEAYQWVLIFPFLVVLSIFHKETLDQIVVRWHNRLFEIYETLEEADMQLLDLRIEEGRQAQQKADELKDRTITKISKIEIKS